MKKFLTLCLALCMALTGCRAPADDIPASDQPEEAPAPAVEDIPFRLAVYDQYSLHPILAENRANLALAPLLYEPLFQLNPQFQAENVLCDSFSVSEDGLTWTLNLRPNVTFSDGTPLTGEIAAAALNTARGENSRFSSRLVGVTGVNGEGNSLTITLSAPNGELPALLDIPIPLDSDSRPLGTGAYVLDQTGEELTLSVREDWWQNRDLPLPSIPLKSVEKSDELILSFESGDVALVDVDLMGTNSLGYSGSYETWDYATTSMLYLGFNAASGLCRSAQVRRALSLGLDRDSIAQVDLARHAIPSSLPVHPGSPLFDRTLARTLAYDPEALGEQLTQLNLTGRTLKLVVNSENSARVAAAQRIADQLTWTGVNVQLEKLAFEDYLLALQQGRFDLYLGEVALTADFDPTQLLSGSLNYGGWSSPELSALLARFRAAAGEVRTAAARELYAHLTQQAPIAPICFKNGSVLTRWGRLSGLEPVRGNVFYHLDRWTMIDNT